MTGKNPTPARFLALAAGLAALAMLPWMQGCSKQASDLQPGNYRATVTLPGDHEVPFVLEAVETDDGLELSIVSGDRRVTLDDVHAEKGSLTATVPGSGGTLSARIAGGDLDGTFTLPAGLDNKKVSLEFAAELGKTHQYFEESIPDNADFTGHWAVTLKDDKGHAADGVIEFKQSFERIAGELSLPGAAPESLSGEVRDVNVLLSYFDGADALFLRGKLDSKGRLTGDTWSATGLHARFVARREPAIPQGSGKAPPPPAAKPAAAPTPSA
jgi:hypothetical protein